MSKRTIAVPIDCEDKTCGKCRKREYKNKLEEDSCICSVSGLNIALIGFDPCTGNQYQRTEECIKSEQTDQEEIQKVLNLLNCAPGIDPVTKIVATREAANMLKALLPKDKK